jgi:hypothetical protein
MLTPRFKWHCDEPGCCVFTGGTEDYDIYMGKCHERPWDPQVILLAEYGMDYEFDTAEEFAKHLEGVNDMSAAERDALGTALTFVQCFFPTPERWVLNEMRKNDAAI